MPSTIDMLPPDKKKRVIDALLSGESLSKVAKMVGISKVQVGVYKNKVVRPAIEMSLKSRAIKDLPQDVVEQVKETQDLTRQAAIADPIIAQIERHDADRARLKQIAESKGELRAWSSLDGNDLRSIELTARLTGRLKDTQNTNNTSILILPQGQSLPDLPDDTVVIDMPVRK